MPDLRAADIQRLSPGHAYGSLPTSRSRNCSLSNMALDITSLSAKPVEKVTLFPGGMSWKQERTFSGSEADRQEQPFLAFLVSGSGTHIMMHTQKMS